MSNSTFNFANYASSLEGMMKAWYEHTKQTFNQSTDLGAAREYFVNNILSDFLPKSVVIGNGEIIDGEKTSGQQDIIIYRSDFPIIKGFGSTHTYLIDGVI